jgi:methyl-accepting chemotaxis protein
MNTRNRIMLPTLGLVTVAVAGLWAVAVAGSTRIKDESVAVAIESAVHELDEAVELTASRSLSHAALFASDPEVVRAFMRAHEGDMTAADDPVVAEAREQLRELFAPREASYRRLTGERRYGLHFHLPTGRSLLRAWDATQAESDDLSRFRQTVVDVNAGVRPTVAGIEVGRTGLAIRGVVPVTDADGRRLGSVEMVADFTPLVHADEDTHMAAYLNAEELRTATALADASRNPRVGDDFVLVKATAPEVLSSLVTEPLLEAARRGPVHEYHGGLVVAAWPVEDHAGRQVAVLVRVQDIQEKFAAIADLRKTMAVIGASLLAALGVAIFFVARSVTGPLDTIVARLREISEGDGDLTQRVDESRSDEFGELGRCFNAFVASLERLVSEVGEGVRSIDAGTAQVSSASQAIAEGTTRQAGQLQEVRQQLESVVDLAAHATERAEQAAGVSGRSRTAADRGREQTQGMNEAMQGIRDSSLEIERITHVIDEIAFQTNLLALNAAVEAARAGESGKGFAVVAEEVRSLAARSAAAAKEIAAMIDEATRRSEAGVGMAEGVSRALEEIAGGITEVDGLLSQIREASREQSEGVDAVTGRIGELEEIVQQHAGSSEELAASAEETASQSACMRELVGRFRVAGD